MNNPTPRPESTHSPERASEAPAGVLTDQRAREALVERLAEAIGCALEDAWGMSDHVHETLTRAATAAVAPLVTAKVEAAVSVVRAERDEAREERDGAREQRDDLLELVDQLKAEIAGEASA